MDVTSLIYWIVLIALIFIAMRTFIKEVSERTAEAVVRKLEERFEVKKRK
ncbi:MAG: hypothetical protein ACE5K0_02990 [Candidatus Methanofastidiosia archaeon]